MKNSTDLSNPKEATCGNHGKPLELFCESCDTVICINCSYRNHKHHQCELITDSYTKHCRNLRESLSPVKQKPRKHSRRSCLHYQKEMVKLERKEKES